MIFTFYSYKGGVGRSMALSNIAELLYRSGMKVLMVDWDLEAPGLEKFFPIDLDEILQHQGVLEILNEFKSNMSTIPPSNIDGSASIFPNINDYIVNIYPKKFGGDGQLMLLTAGKRDKHNFANYANDIRSFNWMDFYKNWDGELFFEWMRQQFKNTADIVLIDSRTGVTEMGGVCTYQFADVIIMLCAPNQQNIDGTLKMAKIFKSENTTQFRRGREIDILVIPARVEDRAEAKLLNEFKVQFENNFNEFLPPQIMVDIDSFWDVKIPHVPFFAFNELLAVGDEDTNANELFGIYKLLTKLMARFASPGTAFQQWFNNEYPLSASYNVNTNSGNLIVGLGGTGIKTLIHVKQQLQEQNSKGLIPSNVQILGIDTMQHPEKIADLGNYDNLFASISEEDQEISKFLDPANEYVYLRCNANDWICNFKYTKKMDSGFLNWFDRNYFCSHSNREILLNISQGSGLYRQLGRLALHYNLRQGRKSTLYRAIKQKIDSLPNDVIQIFICGSLIGGTGSSMFIDIAYLVQEIARDSRKHVKVHGMFVLSNAFKWTANINVDNSMKARATAAIRELLHFQALSSSDVTPNLKICENDPDILKRVRSSPFNEVYLFDQRHYSSAHPLNVAIEYGVTPAIAHWVTLFSDPFASDYLQARMANKDYEIYNRLNPFEFTSMADTFGSYCVSLPIDTLVNLWSIELALETIDCLIPTNESGEIIFDQKGGVSSRSGRAEVVLGDLINSPLGFEIYDLVQKNIAGIPDEYIVNTIIKNNTAKWRSILQPRDGEKNIVENYHQMFTDMDENVSFFYKKESIFSNPFKGALVQPFSKKEHRNSSEIATRLVSRCDDLESLKLGKWKETLADISSYNTEQFRNNLLNKMNLALNGENDKNPSNSRINLGGKLGWVVDYLNELANNLRISRDIFSNAKEIKEQEARHLKLTLDLDIPNSARSKLEQSHRLQNDYLRARQNHFDYQRWALLCTTVILHIDNMLNYTNLFLEELSKIGEFVQTGNSSLAKQLKGARHNIKANREIYQKKINKVCEVIIDEEWETQKYYEFCSVDYPEYSAVNRVLNDIHWDIQNENTITSNNRNTIWPKLQLILIDPNGDRTELGLESDGIEPNLGNLKPIIQKKIAKLLARCKNEFEGVWNNLTVLDYLIANWDGRTPSNSPQRFADSVYEKCDSLLQLPSDSTIQKSAIIVSPEPNNYQRDWLSAVSSRVTEMLDIENEWFEQISHTNNSVLKIILSYSLLEIEKLPSYYEGLDAYLSLPKSSDSRTISRSINHIYLSDQTAMLLEEKSEKQHYSFISPRLINLLEDETKLDTFIKAYAHEFIRDNTIVDNNLVVGIVKEVVIPIDFVDSDLVNSNDTSGINIWWLTEITEMLAPLFLSAETFCLREYDYSEKQLNLWDMHRRLTDAIIKKSNMLLEETYIPMWKNGKGIHIGTMAAQESNIARQRSLFETAMNIQIYKNAETLLNAYMPKIATESANSMWYKQEVAFVELLIDFISYKIKRASNI